MAVVAIALFAEKTRRRWAYDREQARRHENAEAIYREKAQDAARMLDDIEPGRETNDRRNLQGIVDMNNRGAAESSRLKTYYRTHW